MNDISERLKNLSPAQRKLLEKKIREKQQSPSDSVTVPMDFSLFYFSADGTGHHPGKYDQLLESARFADANGFKAVWTPERHFQAFGGLYPNPSVLGAALAVSTSKLRIRSGSVVAPLHHPVRLTEEWSVVDNLSGGRVDLSFATGWHTHDYVIKPENFHQRREIMFRDIDTIRCLWRGETLSLPGVDGALTDVATLPHPVQKELPFWVTASSPRTWVRAGEIGANVLSMVISSISEIGRHVKAYREARLNNGHDPRTGVVSIMLHTYLNPDEEEAREHTRQPLSTYLTDFMDQFKSLPGAESVEDEDALLRFAFERYFNGNALLGSPQKCEKLVHELAQQGVNECACLIDFGLPDPAVTKSLQLLAELRKKFTSAKNDEE